VDAVAPDADDADDEAAEAAVADESAAAELLAELLWAASACT
jgi:hypothetical protein